MLIKEVFHQKIGKNNYFVLSKEGAILIIFFIIIISILWSSPEVIGNIFKEESRYNKKNKEIKTKLVPPNLPKSVDTEQEEIDKLISDLRK